MSEKESDMAEGTVEFENDRVRVSRVRQTGPSSPSEAARHDRLIVYLSDSAITRNAGGESEQIRRRTGDVVWRDASEYTIELTDVGPQEVLIVELKP
jgi:hypothetical protein